MLKYSRLDEMKLKTSAGVRRMFLAYSMRPNFIACKKLAPAHYRSGEDYAAADHSFAFVYRQTERDSLSEHFHSISDKSVELS